VAETRKAGARTIELNLARSANSGLFDEVVEGPAAATVPRFVEDLLRSPK
jgi:NAD-dependent deacetylase